jgi:hypothetical protein
MKNIFFLLTLALLVQILFSDCKKTPEPINCPNGFSADADDNCICPEGKIEVYGQCLPDDSTSLFGVSEGCPCEQDSVYMRIQGRSNSAGQYQLLIEILNPMGYFIGTGLEYIQTPFGYDSLIPGVLSNSNSICYIDGLSYMRRYTGEIYGNDSIVLHFFYTRPNPQNPDAYIYAPNKCKLVLRN